MTAKTEEVPFCGIRLKSKTEKHQAFEKWVGRVLAQPGVKKLFNRMGITKAIIHRRSITIERDHADLEFLMSQWSTETHTFTAS